MAIPTKEQFERMVYKSYLESMSSHPKEKADEYFNGEEARDVMDEFYNEAVKDYNAHKIGDKGWSGVVATTSWNLMMMYDID